MSGSDGLCRSFVYNHLQHSCRLYSHDGRKIPAIIHPANGYDYYRRTAVTGECGGPLQRFYDAKANSNLKLVGAAPPPIPRKKVLSKVDPDGAPAARENFVVKEKPETNQLKSEQDEFVIDQTHSIQQNVKDLQPPPKKEFKEYSDVADPDYLDSVSGGRNVPKKQHSETQKQFDNNSDQALLEGFVKSVHPNRFETRPGSSAGLPGGNGPPVHLPNNPSELGYESPRKPRPRPSQFELRPGSTGGLPGGNRRIVHPPNSPSELGYPERPSGRKQWSTRLPPATPAPPTRHTTPTFSEPEATPSPFIETRPPPSPPSPSQPKSSRRTCQTSTGYYVVIGNEIILPVSGSENDVQVFHGVEQAKCAQFCSSNKGPGGENLQCSSINYFPLQQKCEIYNILAEPHGPGSLVENDDVIYAEKFCLPSHRGNCQEDEIFILHVQKKVETKPLKVSSSNSITSCLQACLNANGCQSASFDSNHRRCSLHAASIGDNPDAAVETDPGWVLIENGCTTRRRKEKTFGVAKKSFNIDVEHEDPAFQWTEWSACRFKIAGRQTVRVRTKKCKEKCADKGLQIERC
uniref:Apple domain-containing protein n=1 Tax=Panagrolaimus sp. ES5 TaxID=591445 RepID=A0AC34GSY9_9BILA